MNGLLHYGGPVLQSKPGLKILAAERHPDDAGAAHEVFSAVGVVAGGPPVAEADAMQAAGIVVDVVMSAKGAPHIVHFQQGRE
ncbi:hypothetical protein D3C73_1555170 [compost metagenome]